MCFAISFLVLVSCALLLLAPLTGFIFAYPLLFIISLVLVDVVSRTRRAFLLLSAFPVGLTGLVTVPVMLKGAFSFELFMMGIWGIASLGVALAPSRFPKTQQDLLRPHEKLLLYLIALLPFALFSLPQVF